MGLPLSTHVKNVLWFPEQLTCSKKTHPQTLTLGSSSIT